MTEPKNSPSLDTLATPPFSFTLTHVSSRVHFYLQQFVEVCDMTFLDLLHRDLRLFEMDILIVKCLKEERDRGC